MPKLKPGTIVPTSEEDKTITVAAMSDEDAMPLTDEEWSQVQPKLKRGRPKATVTKERITIRLSQEVTDYFRRTGKGWQTRLDKVLLDYVASHQ